MGITQKRLVILSISLSVILFSTNRIYAQSQEQAIEMVTAVMKGDIAQVKKLLDSGIPANIRPKGGMHTLQVAVSGNKFEIAKMLVERGANVNGKDW